jgi:chromosome partitioning protein
MYDGRSKLVQSVAEEIQKFFGNKVYNTKIPRNVRLGEAPSYGLPIALYEPRSLGSIAYKGLTEEFFIRNKVKYDKINDISKLKAKVR